MNSIKHAIPIFTVFFLAACGGGSGGKSAPTISNTSAVTSSLTQSSSSSSTSSTSSSSSTTSSQASIENAGIFYVNYGQFSGIYTFLENNEFYGLHFVDITTLAGHPHGQLTSTNSVTSGEDISWANFIDAQNGFGFQESAGWFGRTFSPSGITVKISGLGAAPNMTFSATATQQVHYSSTNSKTIYDNPLSLNQIAGQYSGILRTVGINQTIKDVTNFTINTDGNFIVSVASCTFTGKLIQHEKTGVYDTQVTTSGPSCSLTSSLKGITVPLRINSDTNMELAVQLDDSNNAQSAVFIINK